MKDDTPDNSKTKILVNIYSPLAELMTKKLKKACLKRDDYLDLVLRHECQFLRDEITTPNTYEMKTYISKKIKDHLNTKPVSLHLSKETVDLLNDACDKKNVPRDAFLNRVFLLLIASTDMIRALFPKFEDEVYDNHLWDFWINSAQYGDEQWFFISPNMIDTIEEFVNHSPFWLLRASIKSINENIEKNPDPEIAADRHPNLYTHAFTNESFNKLPDDYTFLKDKMDIICFNTYMNDIQLVNSTGDNELDLLDKLIDANKKEAREALKHRKLIKDLVDL